MSSFVQYVMASYIIQGFDIGTLHELKGKPAALITRLPGRTIKASSMAKCQQVGDVLAKMHLAMRDFEGHSENIRDIGWFNWCRSADQHLSRPRYEALINAYHLIRPFEPSERDEWQNMLRRAALRFWLSRLRDKLFPKDGAITHIKDPNVFKNILLLCREEGCKLC